MLLSYATNTHTCNHSIICTNTGAAIAAQLFIARLFIVQV